MFLWANGSGAVNEGRTLTAQPGCMLAVACHLHDNITDRDVEGDKFGRAL